MVTLAPELIEIPCGYTPGVSIVSFCPEILPSFPLCIGKEAGSGAGRLRRGSGVGGTLEFRLPLKLPPPDTDQPGSRKKLNFGPVRFPPPVLVPPDDELELTITEAPPVT